MSLIRRRLPVGPDGTHGTSTQVSLRCNDLSSDMKSHTAKTWCSMKVTIASVVVRLGVERVRRDLSRASSTAFSSRSMPGWR